MMNRPRFFCKIFFPAVLLIFSPGLRAQVSNLDSLKKNIQNAGNTPARLAALLAFCDQWDSYSPDTLHKYALLAKETAVAENNENALLQSDYYFAAYALQKEKLDTALATVNAIIAKATKKNPYSSIAVKCWLLKANILQRTTHYDEVLQQNLSLLGLAEKNHDTITLVRLYTGIGNVYLRIKKYDQALEWHYKATNLMQQDALKARCSFVYINIAVVYDHLNTLERSRRHDDSIYTNLQRAIRYAREGNNLTNLANSLSMYGNVLAENKKMNPAEAALTEALAIRQKIGDVFYDIADMMALSSFYESSNNFPKAIAVCLQALDLARKNGQDFSSLAVIYSSLSEIYYTAGDYKKYGETINQSMQLQDSMYKANTAEAVTEMETKYEVQKKENTIMQQDYDLAKKNYFIYGSIVLLLLGILFAYILFKQNRKKQKLQIQVLQEEEQRMSAIAVMAAEEKERRRIAAELHDNLGSQLSYISSNMDFILDTPLALTNEEKNKRLDKINETAKNTITDLRETIWALKKETVEMEEIADKLKSFAQYQLVQQTAQLEVREDLAEKLILSPSEALNIFRIFQEAMNNAIKYADAERLNLHLETTTHSGYTISLQDNGKGFDTSRAYPEHYGLENMKERAGEIKAVLTITSEKGKGTIITLSKRSA